MQLYAGIRDSHDSIEKAHGHLGAVQAISFSPDGRELATGGDDRSVRVWRVETGYEILHFADHPGPVRVLRFSANGRSLAVAGEGPGAAGFVVFHEAGSR